MPADFGRVARVNRYISRVPRAKTKSCPCLPTFLKVIPHDASYLKDDSFISQATLKQMIEHLHNNPVRQGLVDRALEWLWSSASWYQ